MSRAPGLVAWVIALPLAGAIVTLLAGRRGPIVGMVASLATTFAALSLAWQVRVRGAEVYPIGSWDAPLGIELRADGIAAAMVATVGIVGVLASSAAFDHLPRGPRTTAFFTSWLFTWAALDALLLSADAFNLYVALELSTLGAVGLVALEAAATGEATGQALRYLVISFLGSLGYLAGVALLYGVTGALDVRLIGVRATESTATSLAFALIIAGLALKAALFPFQSWLPRVYVSAATPATALLSGLVGKGAFFVALRLVGDGFPVAFGPAASAVMGAQGAGAVVWGSLLALRQQRMKAALAYSSVAHVGYLFIGLSIGTKAARSGAVVQAIAHAFAIAPMFLAAGAVERWTRSDALASLRGIAHRHPITFFSFALGGVSLMGLPPSIGFIAKWLLVRAAIERGQWWWAAIVLAGGLLAAGYVFRILRSAFDEPVAEGTNVEPAFRTSEIVSMGLAVLAVVLGVAPTWLMELLEEASP
jgi:formate hydrogenlyase subunit 3/multisubunit Na+/H+ antiporter MnhD subunit